MPVMVRSASCTLTLLPSVREISRQALRSGARPFSLRPLSSAASSVSTAATIGVRRCCLPVSLSTEVDRGRIERGRAVRAMFTFMPMPTTANAMRSGSARVCKSMPPSLRPEAMMSLGHFMPAPRPVAFFMPRAVATAPASVRSVTSTSGSFGLSTTLMYTFTPAGLCHLRPSLPRPLLCESASTTVPVGAPLAASCIACSLVEATSAQ